EAVQAALLETLERLSSEGLSDAADRGDVAALLNAVLARPDLFPRGDPGIAATRFATAQAAALAQLKQGSPVATAMFEGSGFDESVLARGNPKNPGERAPRRFLEAIDGPAPLVPLEQEAGSGRL